MEHPIFFPQSSKDSLASRINQAIGRIKFSESGTEPNHTPKVVERLKDFSFKDDNLSVVFETATMTSHRNGAEKFSGADFSIVATIEKNGEKIKKGIFFQAKKGTVEDLKRKNKSEFDRLLGQIRDMQRFCPNPKILEISQEDFEVPTVVSGTSTLKGGKLMHQPIGDWIARRFLTTFDGSKHPPFVENILEANLNGLRGLNIAMTVR